MKVLFGISPRRKSVKGKGPRTSADLCNRAAPLLNVGFKSASKGTEQLVQLLTVGYEDKRLLHSL
jgi:hypothetical protein